MSDNPKPATVIKWVENLDDLTDQQQLADTPAIDPSFISEAKAVMEGDQITVTFPDGDVRTGDVEWITPRH